MTNEDRKVIFNAVFFLCAVLSENILKYDKILFNPCYSLVYIWTNGLIERFNTTLSRCLAKIIDKDQLNLDEKLDTVLKGYRDSKQASTKHSSILYALPRTHVIAK